MTPIEFSVELTENDIARLHDEVRPYWRAIIRIAYLSIVVSIGGLLLSWNSRPANVAIIASGLWLVLIPRVSKALLVRQFRKNPSALGTIHYEFGENSIMIVSKTARSEVPWQAFLKRKETPGFLCLFLNPIGAYVIPPARITSTQSTLLRELVRSRVPAASGVHSADIPVA